MKSFSTSNVVYILFCVASSGYFCTAAINGWPSPNLELNTGNNSFFSGSSGHSYSSGSNYGRSSGGFGGGGK